MAVHAVAPGRVNLIGDHTDYVGGLAMPMAIELVTEVHGERGGDLVELRSDQQPDPAVIDLADPLGGSRPGGEMPEWARYVAGVVAEVAPGQGFRGAITSTVPVGSGLSSSAALVVAVALAIGFEGTPLELALTCQRGEQASTGIPCGVMDQLASAMGVEGHALLVDFTDLEVEPVPVPPEVEVVVVHSGQPRALIHSAYAERRSTCEAAEQVIGPLRLATPDDVSRIADPIQRRRARHVVSENQRVLDFASALRRGDLIEAGALMVASHRSLADDFEVSTPELDAIVERLTSSRGVFGARLTGAGFGGCVVALTSPGALEEGWHLRPSAGAWVELS